MADKEAEPTQEPAGFTSHTRSLASEYAHEQGWGLNEEERTRVAGEKQDFEGGTDYDYGARDFGDTAVDTSAVVPSPEAEAFLKGTSEATTEDATESTTETTPENTTGKGD